jgi:endonuclease III
VAPTPRGGGRGSGAISRLETLIEVLRRFYGALPSPPGDPFGLFVWEVLSVHSTPRKRDAAFGALRRIRALTPDAMSRAPQKKLEDSVGLAGPYAEQRLRALRTGVDRFRRSPDLAQVIQGPLAAARRALKRLPQTGEGSAYRMLLFAADHPVLPVDVAVRRVAARLGYGAAHPDLTGSARSIRAALGRELRGGDVDELRHAFLYLSNHGSATCTETDPHCAICPVLDDCPSGQKRLR